MNFYQERLKSVSGSITEATATIRNLATQKSNQIYVITKGISSDVKFEEKSQQFIQTFIWTLSKGSSPKGKVV